MGTKKKSSTVPSEKRKRKQCSQEPQPKYVEPTVDQREAFLKDAYPCAFQQCRALRRMTAQGLADLTGIDLARIQALESGNFNISFAEFVRLLAGFDDRYTPFDLIHHRLGGREWPDPELVEVLLARCADLMKERVMSKDEFCRLLADRLKPDKLLSNPKHLSGDLFGRRALTVQEFEMINQAVTALEHE